MLQARIVIFGLNITLFLLSLIDDRFETWSRLISSPSVFALVALHRLEVRKKASSDSGFSIEDFIVVLLGAFNIFYLVFRLRT